MTLRVPSAGDYVEAIQSPSVCFADPELRQGQVEVDRLGLPRPRTGGFATVFRMQCPGGDYAVRCFLRRLDDRQRRYQVLGRFIGSSPLEVLVPTEYLEEGIRVRGAWHPVLKMRWVTGELLDRHVQANLGDPARLRALAAEWMAMVQALEKAGAAHGDLQHGNVLVVGSELKLVDYDGMFVPGLEGETSHERGHDNYQHPARSRDHFGPGLDRFSAWVVYASLLALAADPGLWDRHRGGDEALLLRKADFERPDESAVLMELRASPEPRVRALADELAAYCRGRPQDVPPLAEKPRRPPVERWALDSLLEGVLRTIRLPVPKAGSSAVSEPGSWLADHVPRPPAFRTSPLPERSILAAGVLASLAAGPGVFVTAAAAFLAISGLRYLAEPCVASGRALGARLREAKEASSRIEERLDSVLARLHDAASESEREALARQAAGLRQEAFQAELDASRIRRERREVAELGFSAFLVRPFGLLRQSWHANSGEAAD